MARQHGAAVDRTRYSSSMPVKADVGWRPIGARPAARGILDPWMSEEPPTATPPGLDFASECAELLATAQLAVAEFDAFVAERGVDELVAIEAVYEAHRAEAGASGDNKLGDTLPLEAMDGGVGELYAERRKARDAAAAALDSCKQIVADSRITAPPADESRIASHIALQQAQAMSGTTCITPTSDAVKRGVASHVPAVTFTIVAGRAVEVTTAELAKGGAPFGGTSQWPDTVLYLLRCDDTNCASGSVVAIDDDGNTSTSTPADGAYADLDSRIVISPGVLSAGTYRAVVRAYASGAEGRTKLTVRTGTSLSALTTISQATYTFGGFSPDGGAGLRDSKSGDIIAVGRDNNTATYLPPASSSYPFLTADPEYADTTLWQFSSKANSCTGNCGTFQYNDDAFGIGQAVVLSRIHSGVASSMTGRVLVGTYAHRNASGHEAAMNVRLLHLRGYNTWGECLADLDRDGDGLPWIVEEALGSCDAVQLQVGIPLTIGVDVAVEGFRCIDFAQFVNSKVNSLQITSDCPTSFAGVEVPSNPAHGGCWHPRDTDNDGLRDDQEVFAAFAGFQLQPENPLPWAGSLTHEVLINSTLSGCPSAWCAAVDLSAYSDPDPSVYDVYAHVPSFTCPTVGVCADDKAALGYLPVQEIAPTQQALLKDVWSNWPYACADGATTGTCALVGDNRYRMKLHVYNTPQPIAQPDSLTKSELSWPGGATSRSLTYTHGDLHWRSLGLMHLVVASVHPGGQASDGGAIFGNAYVDSVVNAFSHELGHLMGLPHGHDMRVKPTPTLGGKPFVQAGYCTTSDCSSAGTCNSQGCTDVTCRCREVSCDSANPLATCPTPAGVYKPNNPLQSSLMSYNRVLAGGGMVLCSSHPGSPLCGLPGGDDLRSEQMRFSKGLNSPENSPSGSGLFPLNEQALPERVPRTPATIKLARELVYFSAYGRKYGCAGTVKYGGGIGGSTKSPPFCNPYYCYFDWNEDDTFSNGTVVWDVSHGNADQIGACNDDVLHDFDEIGFLLSFGKQSRRASPTPPLQLAIYQDSFNHSSVPVNSSGWSDLVYSSGVVFDRAVYVRNRCSGPQSTCRGNGACVYDNCSSADLSRCLKTGAACVFGACTCDTDADCHSASCLAFGGTKVCALSVGECGCSSEADCYESSEEQSNQSCSSEGRCAVLRTAASSPVVEPKNSDRWRPYESAKFIADGVPRFIKLSASAGTVANALQYMPEFRVELDLLFEGFTSGSPLEQVIVRSNAWSLSVVKSGGSAYLRGNVAAASSGQLTTGQLEVGRWYRVVWTFDNSKEYDQVIAITPWNPAQGNYQSPTACWVRPIAWSNLPAIGAVTFGGREGVGTGTLNGRIDSLSVWSARSGAYAETSACTTVTQ